MLEPANTPGGAKLPLEQHSLVLHLPGDNSKTASKYVNEALRRGQMTVYVPVDTDNNNDDDNNNNTSQSSRIESEIINYEENVNRGNLLTLDIRSFYNSALVGNTEPFEELKMLIEEAIKERIASGRSDEGVTFVSGIGGMLATNQKFDESIDAEEWWEKTHSEWLQKGLKVTIICSHPNTIIEKKSPEQQLAHYNQAMSSLHYIVVDPGST